MVRLLGHPRRPVRSRRHVAPPVVPHPLPTPAEGPPTPLRRVGRRHWPDVRHRPVHGPGARAQGPQPRPRWPRPRQAPGHLRDDIQDSRRADQDRGVRPLVRLHRSRRRGDAAVPDFQQAVRGLDIGILVNNAGVAKPCAVYLHEVDVEAWVRMIRVNLWALTEMTAAVLPGMVERGRGAVINIGSGSTEAIPSFPLYSVYAATKRYVAQFSRSLYVEYKSKGIDVQCQAPLFVETKMTSSVAKAGKRLSLFVPTSDAYARAAARWIGHRPLCMPNLGHRLQWCLCRVVPDRVHDVLRLRENLRQRAVFQRLRSARAPSHVHGLLQKQS